MNARNILIIIMRMKSCIEGYISQESHGLSFTYSNYQYAYMNESMILRLGNI